MKPSVLAATAHHEAGHAFAAILKGVRFDYVTIEPGGHASGHVQFLSLPDGMERTFHMQAVVAMAGEAAQRRFKPGSVRRHHGAGDREAVTAYAFDNCGGSQPVATMMVRLWALQARELVERWWPEIERLATALLDKRRLSEADCKAALSRS